MNTVPSTFTRFFKKQIISLITMIFLLAAILLPVSAVLSSPAVKVNSAQSLQVLSYNFVPAADAYVDSSNPAANYGSLTTLRGDGSPVVRSYLRFNVQGLSGAVTLATLRIFANSSSSGGYDIQSVSDNTWSESTITYANAPAMGSILGTSGAFSSGVWTSVNVTAYITGNGTYNLALSVPGVTAISFASRESGANAPQLIIETGGSLATSTPTQVPLATSTPTQMPLATATAVPAAGSQVTFNPGADAYVQSNKSSTNFGSLITLRADGSPVVRSYLRFNVQGLTGSVTLATLRVFANTTSNGETYDIQSVSDNTWGESTITYSNAPAVGAVLGSSGSFSGGVWTSVNVTAYITGNGSYNLALSERGTTAISFASRESGTNAPQLVIQTGSVSVATSTATPINSPTPTLIAPNTPTSTPIPVNTATPTPGPTSTPNTSPIKHVFVVVMENHSYNEVWNTSSSPYITSLGNAFAYATNYHATTHPSLPNYLDLYGGSNYGITTDCSPSSSCHVNATNLADNLEAKGLTWKGYIESMPAPCYLTSSGTYAPKHNPMIYFDDIRTNATRCNGQDVPYTSLTADLASALTTPNYALIVPNLCNDMHDCSVSTGDNWLKANLPVILNSPACTVDKCLLVLTWDEDDGSQGNQVLTIFAGSAAKINGATSAVSYTHFSLLRTIENIFGLPTQTSNDAAASPMTDLLR